MSRVLSWKEKAKQACALKGLYELSDNEKNKLCEESFSKLSNIEIDKKKAQETLKILRGD